MKLSAGLSSKNKILNAIGFQLIWWATVFWLEKAVFIALILVGLHFLFLEKSYRKQEIKLVLFCALLGIVTDALLVEFGVLKFQEASNLPIWMISLWIGFSCTLANSLVWVFQRKIITFLLGGLGGLSSYVAAQKLELLEIATTSLRGEVVLFFVWAGLFLCFRKTYQWTHFKGV